MKNKIAFTLIICTIGANALFSQMSPRRDPKKGTLVADNMSYVKQSYALDSAISKHIKQDVNDDDDAGDNPASELYDGAWGTTGVNAFRVELAKVPDSVYFDCTGYIPPVEGEITSIFGPRKKRYHYGIDIKLNVGDPVGSAFEGKVRITRFDKGGYGSYVVVRHNNGLETVYGHLSQILVTEGQSVKAGETIGLVGSTGRSTGPHLHFETRFLGNPINPERFFDFELGEAKASRYFMVKRVAFDYKKASESLKRSAKRSVSASARRFHKVKSGETLSHIADKYGLSVNQLCKINKMSRKKPLRAGQKVRYS